MQQYKRVLIAVDLSSESEQVMQKAKPFIGDKVECHLVYVQEPLDNIYVGVVPLSSAYGGFGELETQLREEYENKLQALGAKYAIAPDRCHFLEGTPSREIHRFVEKQNIELIVMGTHGQKGFKLLLGSTANSVLHGSKCDVLAVRIAEK